LQPIFRDDRLVVKSGDVRKNGMITFTLKKKSDEILINWGKNTSLLSLLGLNFPSSYMCQGLNSSNWGWVDDHPLHRESMETMEPRQKPPTFHHTGCLIGLLIMVKYNPHITG